MSQKVDLQNLQTLSLSDIQAHRADALRRKAELEALKTKGGKAWTPELQDELNEIALLLVDIDDVIEEKQNEATSTTANGYVIKPGTEKMVHLSLVRGFRFNPNTGEEVSKPFVQMFTFSEWQLFKNNFNRLGYSIVAALHDPYGDAKDLVMKK